MNNKKHVSLKDLAEELGVSVSTVSRALKDSPEVGEEMRERVKKLAGEWNYRPNPFAISLLKNNPRIIGIIVPDIVTHFILPLSVALVMWHVKSLFCYNNVFL